MYRSAIAAYWNKAKDMSSITAGCAVVFMAHVWHKYKRRKTTSARQTRQFHGNKVHPSYEFEDNSSQR